MTHQPGSRGVLQLVLGSLLILAGIFWLVPSGTRLTGIACPPGVACPLVGVVERIGIFGQPLNFASVTLGMGSIVAGTVVVLTPRSWRRSQRQRRC